MSRPNDDAKTPATDTDRHRGARRGVAAALAERSRCFERLASLHIAITVDLARGSRARSWKVPTPSCDSSSMEGPTGRWRCGDAESRRTR